MRETNHLRSARLLVVLATTLLATGCELALEDEIGPDASPFDTGEGDVAYAIDDQVGYWRLDESSGTTATDASGNGNHLTLFGNATFTSAGRFGRALSLDGTDDHAARTSPSAVLKPTTAVAMSAWVKLTTTDTSGADVVSMGDNYALRVAPDGNVKAWIWDETTYRMHTTTGVNIKDGQWHHLVGQFTGTRVQVFVDGVFRGEIAETGPITYTRGTAFRIGRHGNTSTAHDFPGAIDEVRVYRHALTAAEVSALAGSSPTRMRVITWNLKQSSSSTAQQQAALLLTHNPDVIITQETYASSAAALATRLGSGWTYRFFSSGSSEGDAIFTRLPVVGGPENHVIGPSSWGGNRVAIRTQVQVGTRAVNVFVTHLDWPRHGVWTEDREHAQGRNELVRWIDTFPGRKVYGGDMNAYSTGTAVQARTISELDLRGTDSCRIHGSHTFCNANYPTKSSRLDYLYRSSELTTISHAVMPLNSLSDHRMVVAEFAVP